MKNKEDSGLKNLISENCEDLDCAEMFSTFPKWGIEDETTLIGSTSYGNFSLKSYDYVQLPVADSGLEGDAAIQSIIEKIRPIETPVQVFVTRDKANPYIKITLEFDGNTIISQNIGISHASVVMSIDKLGDYTVLSINGWLFGKESYISSDQKFTLVFRDEVFAYKLKEDIRLAITGYVEDVPSNTEENYYSVLESPSRKLFIKTIKMLAVILPFAVILILICHAAKPSILNGIFSSNKAVISTEKLLAYPTQEINVVKNGVKEDVEIQERLIEQYDENNKTLTYHQALTQSLVEASNELLQNTELQNRLNDKPIESQVGISPDAEDEASISVE